MTMDVTDQGTAFIDIPAKKTTMGTGVDYTTPILVFVITTMTKISNLASFAVLAGAAAKVIL